MDQETPTENATTSVVLRFGCSDAQQSHHVSYVRHAEVDFIASTDFFGLEVFNDIILSF